MLEAESIVMLQEDPVLHLWYKSEMNMSYIRRCTSIDLSEYNKNKSLKDVMLISRTFQGGT